jgi:hypothetical protein
MSRWRLLLLACVVLVAGCIDRSQSGNTTVFTFASWVICLPAVPGVALLAIGAFLFFGTKSYRWGGLGLIVLGIALMVFLMPMLAMSRVEVDDEHFVSTRGLPFAMSRDEEKFDDLADIQVEETIETRNGVESRRTYALICTRKSGQANTVPIGDLMRGASSDILTRAKRKGVPMRGMEALPADLRPR